jgi:anti-sigma factor RsiW
MALNKKMLEQEPSEIEVLLPWHAAGTLNARDARRVEEALARDPELAKQYAAIRVEYDETIHLNESLGAPSGRAMQKLFAAIDAEPARAPATLPLSVRLSAFFASLSPRTLAWSAGLGAIALLLQAGVIGAVLVKTQTSTFQTASLTTSAPVTRELASSAATTAHALVRFTPDARVADITTLLDSYQAAIVDGAKGGLFRLQFNKAMSQDELTSLLGKMQREKIVNLAVAAP